MNSGVINSMLLALVTGQRLDDIASMKFTDISDGWLHIKQHKSGSLLRLSLDLCMNVLDISINNVVSRCRDRVVSRYLIHHTKTSAKTKAGTALKKFTISKGFKSTRSQSGLAWDNPPTFHGIRSLSGR
jgi:integrase